MLIGAVSPVATSRSASGGGSDAIGVSLAVASSLGSAPAVSRALATGDRGALGDAAGDVDEGDGVAHAASVALMTSAVSTRSGLNIGPILGRSGRVEPQR
jgi:hypothetical protein